MNLDRTFPAKYYLNLGRREDRRLQVENALIEAGLEDVERIPAVDGRWMENSGDHRTAARYARALTHKMAIRRARQRKTPAVLIFEDDVILAGNLRERLSEIELPDDWGIFLLGCQHLDRPEVAGPGLVRCLRTADMHAYAVRAEYYEDVMGILAKTNNGRAKDSLTTREVRLQQEIPTYAAWPNLVWQARSRSDVDPEWVNDNYLEDGRQAKNRPVVSGVDWEVAARIAGRMLTTRFGQCGTAGKPLELSPGPEGRAGRQTATSASGRSRSRCPVPVWVLNLDRSPGRLAQITRDLQDLGIAWERVRAIDGRNLTADQIGLYSPGLAKELVGRVLSPGEIGCALSHIRIWEEMVELGMEELLVLEDDAVPGEDLLEFLNDRALLPGNWEFINFRTDARMIPTGVLLAGRFSLCRFTMAASGAVAYLIRRAGALRLLRYAFPISMASDGLTGRAAMTGLISYGVQPQPVGLQKVVSDIWST